MLVDATIPPGELFGPGVVFELDEPVPMTLDVRISRANDPTVTVRFPTTIHPAADSA